MLGLISDIHGNLPALEAALNDMEEFGVEGLLCLGDVANFGPQPQDVLQRVRDLNCPVVLGNTDAYLLEPRTHEDVAEPDENTDFFLEVEAWCAEQLNAGDCDFVRTFQPTHAFDYRGVTILAYHGSPLSYDDPITATTPDETLQTYLGKQETNLLIGGHTHTQFIRRYFDNWVMNPGSVGSVYAQRKDGSHVNFTVAEYALLEIVDGEPNLHFRRVPYDLNKLTAAVRNSDMPHQDSWLGGFKTRSV